MSAEPVVRREAVRVAVLDSERRLLLLRVRDPKRPDELWWELPGGGIEVGEDPSAAAIRELREETGIEIDAVQRRIGVVETEFDFNGHRYRQRETVFVVVLDEDPPSLDGHRPPTELEAFAHVGHRWWPSDEELPAVKVHPPQLRRLIRELR